MSYIDFLKKKEWFAKCNHILQRDEHKCQDCGCLGYHNGTIYSTDSLDEVDNIINQKILLGEKFSSLIEQTLNELQEYNNVYSDGYYIGPDEEECSADEIKRYKLLEDVPLRWEAYHEVEIREQKIIDNLFINKICLQKDYGLFFRDLFEVISYATVITKQKANSFDFKLHRYRKFLANADGSLTTYPMALLLFEQNLSDKYYLSIEYDSISVTYKNYVFFVNLSPYNFTYKGLNIHHKYYIKGKKPWEYDNNALITLCEDCHRKRHESSIPQYRSLIGKGIDSYCEKCDKCNGTGYLSQYNHIEHGVCFKCGGEGTIINW